MSDQDFEPFDQEAKLGPPPWEPSDPALQAWEAAHGHDVRLKCYAEFGCRAIEPALESQVASLTEENERAEDFRAEIVVDAFTSPDADWGTILDSLRSRIRDLNSSLASERAGREDLKRKLVKVGFDRLEYATRLSEAEQRTQEAWKAVKENQARYSTLLNEQTQRAIEAEQRAVVMQGDLAWCVGHFQIGHGEVPRFLKRYQRPNPESETDDG